MKKFRWIDLALVPFGLCVLFLLLLGKLLGLTYKQISVVFNLWVQGAVLALSGLAPFGIVVYKMTESFSIGWLVLSFILALYGTAYVFAFIIMVRIIVCHLMMLLIVVFGICKRWPKSGIQPIRW